MGATMDSPAAPASRPDRKHAFSSGDALRSVFSNWAGFFVNVLVAMFLTPLVVHKLGNDAYGLWALLLQLTGYMGVIDVGMRSATMRFVARYWAVGDQSSLNRVVTQVLAIYGVAALLCAAIGFSVAFVILPHLEIPMALQSTARIAMLLATATLALSFPFAVFSSTLAGLSRWTTINAIGVGSLLVRTACILFALRAGHGLLSLAVIQLVTTVGAGITSVILVRRFVPTLRLYLKSLDWNLFRPVFAHTSYSFLTSVANRINYEVDAIVIAAFLPIQNVAFYVIGFKLVQYLRDAINATTQIIGPLVSALDAQGQTERIGHVLVRASRYVLLIGYLCAAALLVFGKDFLRLWMGAQYGARSGSVLLILAATQFVGLTQNVPGHILIGLSKHKLDTWCTSVEAGLNLVLSLILVRRFGIAGVAAGTAIAVVVVRGFFFPAAYLHIFRVPWARFVFGAVLPATGPALMFTVVALALRQMVGVRDFSLLALYAACGAAASLPVAWFVTLDEVDRNLVKGHLRTCIGSSSLADAEAE
jgi:O-antigen/teichoic acid export membrane protein